MEETVCATKKLIHTLIGLWKKSLMVYKMFWKISKNCWINFMKFLNCNDRNIGAIHV